VSVHSVVVRTIDEARPVDPDRTLSGQFARIRW